MLPGAFQSASRLSLGEGLDIIGELHEACHDGMVGSCQQLPVLQSSSLHEQCSTPLSEDTQFLDTSWSVPIGIGSAAAAAAAYAGKPVAGNTAGCLFFTPQSVHQEDAAGPGEGEEVQQDLPVKRKLDLSTDEVETGMFLRKRLPSGQRQPESSSEGGYSDASLACSGAELPGAEDATDDSALSHATGAAHVPPGPTSSFRINGGMLQAARTTSWGSELSEHTAPASQLPVLPRGPPPAGPSSKEAKACTRCALTNPTTNPKWRPGPLGHRHLCNGCGIKWARLKSCLEKRKGLSKSERTEIMQQLEAFEPTNA